MRRTAQFGLVLLAAILPARHANAQQLPTVEVSAVFWRPDASLVLASDGAGLPGTPIDLKNDLRVSDRGFPALELAVRPARRHRLAFEYIAIRYDATATLSRAVAFSGATYARGDTVASTFSWDAFNIGYEYDVVLRPALTLGAIVEAKGTIVEQRLTSSSADRSRRTNVPAPALGFALRGRVAPRVMLYTEARAFAIPDSRNGHYGGRYVDVDGGGTVDLAPHLAARGGVRWLNIRHLGAADSARMSMPGAYVGVVLRK